MCNLLCTLSLYSKEKEIASLQQKTEEDANEISSLQRKIRELQVSFVFIISLDD